jgi:hypothetical protein
MIVGQSQSCIQTPFLFSSDETETIAFELGIFSFFFFFPFDETMTELILRHQHQNWMLKD